MKVQHIFGKTPLVIACLFGGSFFFQSCAPVDNSVKPVSPEYMVTVKVIDHNSTTATNVSQDVKHFHIVTDNGIVFDADINGDYSYTFKSNTPNVNVKATLTSSSYFTNAMEVDANGKMYAYHNGSCAGPSFEITDNIRF